ncbi:MAG: rhodanese-like domain-containing protein [Cyanobacteria bacterium P01_G01_bin.19]
MAGIAISLSVFGFQPNITAQSAASKRSQIIAMYREYAREFPQVKGITVQKLQQLQQQNQNIILVDVRSPKEREVSIIPGAITSEEFEANLEQYEDSNAIIVAYCTIGYRSGKYASKLRQQGIEILNLEGSLLAWSYIEGKLVDRNGSTNKVHVFGRQWQLTADDYQPIW